MSVELKDIKAARTRIAQYIVKTPLRRWEYGRRFVKHASPLFLKLETFQNTGSFKVRGACNKILHLRETAPSEAQHFIAASAGNHAQAVAFVAGRLGVKSTIVMPEGTPLVKSSATADYGAEVILHGALYDEAYARAIEVLEKTPGAAYVHAYADEDVIAGQGTAGLEIHEQLLEEGVGVDSPLQVIVPIGGGGLISGVGLALKALRPGVKIFGVVAEVADAMALSLEAGEVVKSRASASRTLAEGLAVKSVHPLTFAIIQSICEKIAIVDDDEVAHAIFTLMERGKLVTEGAGAAGIAALFSRKLKLDPNVPTVVVLCGGNIDMNKVSTILEKALVRNERWLSLEVVVDDKPGELARLTSLFGSLRANVLDIIHDRLSESCPVGYTKIRCRLETRGPDHAREVAQRLKTEGYSVRLLS
jgi:threonine dehydratase